MSQMIIDIVNVVRELKTEVTFVDLENRISNFGGGDFEIGLASKNWVYWGGLTNDAVGAIGEIIKGHPEIDFKPGNVLSYFVDGKVLKYPVVKSLRAFKKPHWMPLFFFLKS